MTDPTPAYPIPRPAREDDARFCCGLGFDVTAVLHRYGHPPIATGADRTCVQQALFTLIYHQEETR